MTTMKNGSFQKQDIEGFFSGTLRRLSAVRLDGRLRRRGQRDKKRPQNGSR
jgi:hypothetical protein